MFGSVGMKRTSALFEREVGQGLAGTMTVVSNGLNRAISRSEYYGAWAANAIAPSEQSAINLEEAGEKQRKLEGALSQFNDYVDNGIITGFGNEMLAGVLESLNPVDFAVNSISAGLGSKVAAGLKIATKYRPLAASAVDGIIGGSWEAAYMNSLYDDMTPNDLAIQIGLGTITTMGFGMLSRKLSGKPDIEVKAKNDEVKFGFKEGTVENDNVKATVNKFKSNTSGEVDTPRKKTQDVIRETEETLFWSGDELSAEDKAKMVKLPEMDQDLKVVDDFIKSEEMSPYMNELNDLKAEKVTGLDAYSNFLEENRGVLKEFEPLATRLEKNKKLRKDKKFMKRYKKVYKKVKEARRLEKAVNETDKKMKSFITENIDNRLKEKGYNYRDYINQRNFAYEQNTDVNIEVATDILSRKSAPNINKDSFTVDGSVPRTDNVIQDATQLEKSVRDVVKALQGEEVEIAAGKTLEIDSLQQEMVDLAEFDMASRNLKDNSRDLLEYFVKGCGV